MDEEFWMFAQHQFLSPIQTSSKELVSGTDADQKQGYMGALLPVEFCQRNG